MRRQTRPREISVGVTLMLSLVIFASLVLLLGRESRIFRPGRTYWTTVTNSLGLKPGSPVVMGGVQIGTVARVSLQEDPQSKGITLGLSVDRAFAERIRGDSIASVGLITLLSGEKYVEVSPGDPNQPVLPDGARIPPDTSESLLETGQNVAENLAAVTGQLREILASINSGEGLIGQIVRSKAPYFGESTIAKINSTFDRTDRLLGQIEAGEGLMGKLFVDRDYARQTLGSVKSAAERVDRLLETVEKKEGTFGELLRDDGKGKLLLADLTDASASLKTVAAKLESRTGLFGRLLNDPEYSEAVANDLRSAAASLSSILKKIDNGEGTAGALINNPSVYESIEDIVRGLGKSGLAKKALQHYGKKGAKQEENTPKVSPAPK